MPPKGRGRGRGKKAQGEQLNVAFGGGNGGGQAQSTQYSDIDGFAFRQEEQKQHRQVTQVKKPETEYAVSTPQPVMTQLRPEVEPSPFSHFQPPQQQQRQQPSGGQQMFVKRGRGGRGKRSQGGETMEFGGGSSQPQQTQFVDKGLERNQRGRGDRGPPQARMQPKRNVVDQQMAEEQPYRLEQSAFSQREENKSKSNQEKKGKKKDQLVRPEVDPEQKDLWKVKYETTEVPEDDDVYILKQMSLLQKALPANSVTPTPVFKTQDFGKEAIQPVMPPLTFNHREGADFEASVGPWRKSKDQVLAGLLAEKDNKFTAEALDPLFKPDLGDLMKRALTDSFNYNPEVQSAKRDYIAPKLDSLLKQLAYQADLQMEPTELITSAKHDVVSGLLSTYEYSEPLEDPEQENIRLENDKEIEALLQDVDDPFGEEEGEEAKEVDLLKMFSNIQESEVLSSQVIFSQANKTVGVQQKVARQEEEADLDDEDEESKSARDPSEPQDSNQNEGLSSAPQDEIDEIVGDSTAFDQAVDLIKKGGASQLVQAEPSHFHLAAVSNERNQLQQINHSRAMNELQKQSQATNDNWVVTDNLDMKNFKELIPDLALEYDFELDDFQKRAVYRLEQGNCVMVAAHTSAGKTVVAEYAIALARKHMTKVIYTSPIKSLSNQKYRDFKLRFGDVGVLTGDVQLNKDAQVVIMTTEVLQQMLYNNSNQIEDVEWVIFDEVHYINDAERGSVWEEVIMKLPDTVSIVMLSATVPNYLEFANWVGRTKQKKIYVQYTQHRPVPLEHHAVLDGKMTLLKAHKMPVDSVKLKQCSNKRWQLKNGQGPPKRDDKKVEQEDPGKKKKIDFKEKAINAKENSIKKVIAKATKGGTGGNGGGGEKGPNSGKQKKSNFQKTLLSIEKMKLLPTIVFAFSRDGCMQLGEQLDPSVDFTDGYTKGLIKKFIKQKLQRLDESDRELPQIKAMTNLLVRGIGVHHAGLLQLLKELVEILFSDGYLKVVFATSTFAIGLNLPARSVVFTQLKKFDGDGQKTLSTSEYLQMAGRAGRRGKDDRGFSVLCMDPEHGSIPSNQEMHELLESKGVELESKLKIDYKTCLNVLKQEQGEIGSLLQNSFFAHEDTTVKITYLREKKQLEPKYNKAKDISCVYGVPDQAFTLHGHLNELWNVTSQLNIGIVPDVLQIVEVVTAKHLLKPMVILRAMKDHCLCLFAQEVGESMPIQYEENSNSFEDAQSSQNPRTTNVPGTNLIYCYEYVEIGYEMITKFYKNALTEMQMSRLTFLGRNQLNDKQLKAVLKEYSKVKVLSEDTSMSKTKAKKKRSEMQEKQSEIVRKMQETKCWGCDQVSYHLTQVDSYEWYDQKMQEIEKVLSGGVDQKEQDFKNRNSILTHYKIIDNDMNLLFKGKVAAKAPSVDSILITEFFFSGLISKLTDQELLAVLSIFNTRERARGNIPECTKYYSEAFTQAVTFVQEEAEKLIALEGEFGVIGEEDNVGKRLNMKFYETVYDWADGKQFIDFAADSGIAEGSIVKMFMTVDRLRLSIAHMASEVGDNTMAKRLDEMKPLIMRGIVMMQSLYLEVEQEPPRLAIEDQADAMPEPGQEYEEESKERR